MFHGAFAQDVDATEAHIMAVVQKPFTQSIFTEKSGPPAWKQHPTWYQVSDSDHMIPPDAQRLFAKQHPNEIAQLILNATKGSTK
jgi:hypothetical protein